MNDTTLIVIGSLHTDIIAHGIKRFPHAGELVRGKQLLIGPGGKSRNIAAMASYLSPVGSVALIGRTIQDAYGLWKPPMSALEEAGVNTDFVYIESADAVQKMPAITLIPVNEQGESQIFLLPGISDDFSLDDIDKAQVLFDVASKNKGFLALTLECPLATLQHAIQKARNLSMRVVFDPGGLEDDMDASEIVAHSYVVKPNEHEAKLLTGVTVTDFDSARMAASQLQQQGATNVLVTHGEHGAYLFTESEELSIPVPALAGGSVKDATGCGDQATAMLCVALQQGKSLTEAAQLAVRAGTLQFYKPGIQPLTQQELTAQL